MEWSGAELASLCSPWSPSLPPAVGGVFPVRQGQNYPVLSVEVTPVFYFSWGWFGLIQSPFVWGSWFCFKTWFHVTQTVFKFTV